MPVEKPYGKFYACCRTGQALYFIAQLAFYLTQGMDDGIGFRAEYYGYNGVLPAVGLLVGHDYI